MMTYKFDESAIKTLTPIVEGCSNDKKFFLETFSGEKFLLRISDVSEYEIKQKEFMRLKAIEALGIPFSKPIHFGVEPKTNQVHTLLEWVEGIALEKEMPSLSEREQYLLGVKAGKMLRKVHCIVPEGQLDNWGTRYYQVMNPRIEAFKAEGISFKGSEAILAYLDENKQYLNERSQCQHHGDFHIGNIILKKNQELSIIDWQTVDFDNVGDPWYEFNRINTNHTAFASGQIIGYFDGQVPDAFWRLFAYYLSATALTAIVWAKYHSKESLGDIMESNYTVLDWFDYMRNPVPKWFYTRDGILL